MIRGKAEPSEVRDAKQNALIQSDARKNKSSRFSALQSKLPPSFLSQKSVICMKFCAQATMVCKILKAFGPAVLHRATRAANKTRKQTTRETDRDATTSKGGLCGEREFGDGKG